MLREQPTKDGAARFVASLKTYSDERQYNHSFLVSLRHGYVFAPLSKVANSSINGFLF